jgi:hypothetical protein
MRRISHGGDHERRGAVTKASCSRAYFPLKPTFGAATMVSARCSLKETLVGNRLEVRVNDELVLDAGIYDESPGGRTVPS